MLHTEDHPFDPERVAALSPAERRVADFLEHGGSKGLLLSAAAIGERLGTSDATVVRTAQALGFSGLGDLRQALAAHRSEPALADRLHRTLDGVGPDQVWARVIANHLSGLDALTDRVTSALFEQAVATLDAGERIVWRGVGPSACLAEYATLLATRVGRSAVAWTHTGTSFADELLGLRASDAVVVLAYGRRQRHVEALLDRARAMGSPVVLITDARPRRADEDAAVVIESGRGLPGRFASHTATLVLLEGLVLGLAARDEPAAEASLAQLNDLRATIAGRRLDVDAP